MMNLYYNILDDERKNILHLLRCFKKDFYLAGGTGLALQIGHRDSVDFDFFTKKDFSALDLFKEIKRVLRGYNIKKTQEDQNTLSVSINRNIKLSFFTYKYKLIDKLKSDANLNLASMADIGCMKLTAITSRATEKDYVDLYFVIKEIGLRKLLSFAKTKFPDISLGLLLKSLVYFNDLVEEPIIFKNNNKVSFSIIKSFIQEEVKNYQKFK